MSASATAKIILRTEGIANWPSNVFSSDSKFSFVNIGKLFGNRLVLTLNPFVCAEQGHFLCNLWRREVNHVVTEWLNNGTDFCSILCQLLQFLFLYLKFTCFVIQLRLIFCNELLYICFLRLIFVKSYLARRESFINFFKPVPSGKHFPFKFPYHCLQPLDCFLRLFRIFGQFPDIIAFTKMVDVPAFNAVTTFQPVLAPYLFI